jgi:hypothetical protein
VVEEIFHPGIEIQKPVSSFTLPQDEYEVGERSRSEKSNISLSSHQHQITQEL